jgi:hypothetical protein
VSASCSSTESCLPALHSAPCMRTMPRFRTSACLLTNQLLVHPACDAESITGRSLYGGAGSPGMFGARLVGTPRYTSKVIFLLMCFMTVAVDVLPDTLHAWPG